MKLLKKILLIIIILIALPFVIAIFVPKDYAVERNVIINKPKAEVFDYIKHIKNQDNYSVWNMADPDMKKTYTGTDGSVGFIYAWNGNDKVGEGEQEITDVNEGKSVEMELRFKRPFESTGKAYMFISTPENGTTVTWGMKGHSSYPMNFMNLFMNNMIGKDIQQGLDNMKSNLENNSL